MKLIAQNKKARHDYFIEESYEAGLKLLGSEIKSIRLGKVTVNDSFVTIKDGEAFVHNMHIAKYDFSNRFNHDETRPRKLLLHKKEIIKLKNEINKDGYTIIPLKLYLKEGKVKILIGVCKGKHLYDKRETIKKRDLERETRQYEY